MRAMSAYRTISAEAVFVIARMIPIGIILMTDNECYKRKGIRGVQKIVRTVSIPKWQQEWNTDENGR